MVQIRASRSARDPQHLSNLCVRKALNIMHHYHRPRPRLKLRQGSLEPLFQLTALRRIVERGRNRFRELFGGTDLLAPSQIEGRIGDDPIEPRAERLSRVEPFEGLVRAQESVLNRVFSVLMRHDDRPRHYIRASLVQTHKAGKTPLVALSGQTYELSLLIRNTYGCSQLLTG